MQKEKNYEKTLLHNSTKVINKQKYPFLILFSVAAVQQAIVCTLKRICCARVLCNQSFFTKHLKMYCIASITSYLVLSAFQSNVIVPTRCICMHKYTIQHSFTLCIHIMKHYTKIYQSKGYKTLEICIILKNE